MPFSNQLTDAETERLAVLLEELGEAQQCVGKILRHGYESINPHGKNDDLTNRCNLQRELGDVLAAIEMLADAQDVSAHQVNVRRTHKLNSIQQWLHHQPAKGESKQ